MVKLLTLKHNGFNLRRIYIDNICRYNGDLKNDKSEIGKIKLRSKGQVKRYIEKAKDNIPFLVYVKS